MKAENANEYTGEAYQSETGFRLASVLLAVVGLMYRAMTIPKGLLNWASTIVDGCFSNKTGRPRLILTLEKEVGELNLVISNRSCRGIWAQEARVHLIDVKTNGETYTPSGATLRICEFIGPSETLRISLIGTIYDIAERPQGVYSCLISTVMRFRPDESDEEFEQTVAPYDAAMVALVPISLRRAWAPKDLTGSQFRERARAVARGVQNKRARRSHRVPGQAAVLVEGRLDDGSPFSDLTHALVLSAHGCLVTLEKRVRIGDGLVVHNMGTSRRQTCQVVYLRECNGGQIQVGLAFETEAPDFWGVDCLPTIGEPLQGTLVKVP
jgi:hypothetical protein